jgi:hypothetical protein
MPKMIPVVIAVLAAGLWCAPTPASGQEKSNAAIAAQEPSKAAEKGIKPYRLDFALNEVEGGKTINTRHYTMNLNAGDHNEIKIGTRVPVSAGHDQYQYLDVGTRIDARLNPENDAGEIQLHVNSEISNLDTTAPDEHLMAPAPIVRQIKIEGSTLLTAGKPLLIGSVDDPNSKREFQLEVVATKLR